MDIKPNPKFLDRVATITAVATVSNLKFSAEDVAAVKKAREVIQKLETPWKNFSDSDFRRAEVARRQNEISSAAIENPDKILESRPRDPAREVARETENFFERHRDITRDLGKKLAPCGRRMLAAWISAAEKLLDNQRGFEKSIAEKFSVGHVDSNLVVCLELLLKETKKNLAGIEQHKSADPGIFRGLC